MVRRLHYSIRDGHTLTESELKALWRLRTRYLTLTKTEAEDFFYFRSFVTTENGLVVIFIDPAGKVQGFFTSVTMPLTWESRRGLVLYTKYFYMDKRYRGHPKSMLTPWLVAWRAWWKYGFQALYFTGTAFPQSYVSIARTAGNVHTLADKETTAWERYALLEFMHRLYPDEWDDEKQVIRNQNVPDAKRTITSQTSQQLLDRYEQINPTWREGHSIPMIFAVNLVMATHALIQTAKRLIGRSL